MAEFVAGSALATAFYAEVVGPLLRDVPHAAALWGTGSDVLGYDTAQSTDHGWGPRMQVFVAESDVVGPGRPSKPTCRPRFAAGPCATAGTTCRCSTTCGWRPSPSG
jgi:hypothetical protein